jgi:hypothetical protein
MLIGLLAVLGVDLIVLPTLARPGVIRLMADRATVEVAAKGDTELLLSPDPEPVGATAAGSEER